MLNTTIYNCSSLDELAVDISIKRSYPTKRIFLFYIWMEYMFNTQQLKKNNSRHYGGYLIKAQL